MHRRTTQVFYGPIPTSLFRGPFGHKMLCCRPRTLHCRVCATSSRRSDDKRARMNFRFKLPDLLTRAAAKSDAPPDARALRAESDALASVVASFLSKTGLFDREAYARAHPDTAKSGLDPLHHYVRFGIHAGRNFTSQ